MVVFKRICCLSIHCKAALREVQALQADLGYACGGSPGQGASDLVLQYGHIPTDQKMLVNDFFGQFYLIYR